MGAIEEIVYTPFDTAEAYAFNLLIKARANGAKVPLWALSEPARFFDGLAAAIDAESIEEK